MAKLIAVCWDNGSAVAFSYLTSTLRRMRNAILNRIIEDTQMSNATELIREKIVKISDDDLYRQNVEKLMLTGSTELISNNLPQHAAALLSCFFRNATSEIKIFCNTLRREVYDSPEVLSSMLAAAGKGIPIKILVRGLPEDGSEFFPRFTELALTYRKLSIQTNGAARSRLVKEQSDNFSVMDRKAYRWETDCENVHAVACMNSPSLGSLLSKSFDMLYSAARYPV